MFFTGEAHVKVSFERLKINKTRGREGFGGKLNNGFVSVGVEFAIQYPKAKLYTGAGKGNTSVQYRVGAGKVDGKVLGG